MSDEDNPFFAKSLVNRYWKHFFQRGLIEPEDDIRDTNPPTNPELLAALEKHFIASGFDLKELVRVITQSHAYQLSAMPNEYNAVDRQNFSHYYPRRLQAEVLLDAIDQSGRNADRFREPAAGHAGGGACPTTATTAPRSSCASSAGRKGPERLRVRAGAVVEPGAEPASDQLAGDEGKLANASGRAERLAKEDQRPKRRSANSTWPRSRASRGPRIEGGARLPDRTRPSRPTASRSMRTRRAARSFRI